MSMINSNDPEAFQSTNLSQVYSSNNYLSPLESLKDAPHTFRYLKASDIQKIGMTEKRIYAEAVQNLPIPCVDVFLFNPASKSYLLVLRKDPPAKNFWWPPGGRVYKGETLAECAKRKCREELGLRFTDVTVIKNLGVVETFFPDSAWNTQTHTINTLYLVLLNSEVVPNIDNTCQNYKWVPIDTIPEGEDPYVKNIHTLAAAALKDHSLQEKAEFSFINRIVHHLRNLKLHPTFWSL
jgi:colanic acid biosynthesis protein WcaH